MPFILVVVPSEANEWWKVKACGAVCRFGMSEVSGVLADLPVDELTNVVELVRER